MEQEQPILVLIPWTGIGKIRVNEGPDNAGEYEIEGRDGARLTGYDLSGLIAEQDPDKFPQRNPRLASQENGDGAGWTNWLRGHADNPYLMNAVMRRLSAMGGQYLILMRERQGPWSVVGNTYGGDLELHTGGYTSTVNGRKWHEGSPLDYEFECPYQYYPVCLFNGDIDINPVEDFLTMYRIPCYECMQ